MHTYTHTYGYTREHTHTHQFTVKFLTVRNATIMHYTGPQLFNLKKGIRTHNNNFTHIQYTQRKERYGCLTCPLARSRKKRGSKRINQVVFDVLRSQWIRGIRDRSKSWSLVRERCSGLERSRVTDPGISLRTCGSLTSDSGRLSPTLTSLRHTHTHAHTHTHLHPRAQRTHPPAHTRSHKHKHTTPHTCLVCLACPLLAARSRSPLAIRPNMGHVGKQINQVVL